jgi:hypothetical protein
MPYDFDNKYLDMIRADFSIDNEDTRPNREELRKTFKGVSDKTFEDFAKQSSKMLLGLENLLLLRGVEENKAKELSYKVMIGAYKDNLTKDERDVADAYRKLVRTLRDNISRDQLVEALKARFSHKDDDVAAKILENHKKSKTGWDDNGMYSRTGLPSWELYEKHLFKDEPTKGIAKPVFSTAGDSYVSGRRSGDKVIIRETSNEEAKKRLKESASHINADELD